MKTTLRTLVLVTATAVCFTSFADARNGSGSANTLSGSGSDDSVQRQTVQSGGSTAAPDQVRTTKRDTIRSQDCEPAAGKAKGKGKGSGKGKGNGNGKADGSDNGSGNGNGNGNGQARDGTGNTNPDGPPADAPSPEG